MATAEGPRAALQLVVERWTEAFKRQDPVAMAQFYSSDAVVESPMFATLRGRKAIEDAQRAFFTSFPDATTTLDATIIDPPQMAVFTTINATHVNEFFGMPGTNRHIEFRNARLMEMDGQGLIAHERRIYDFTGALCSSASQVGPAKP